MTRVLLNVMATTAKLKGNLSTIVTWCTTVNSCTPEKVLLALGVTTLPAVGVLPSMPFLDGGGALVSTSGGRPFLSGLIDLPGSATTLLVSSLKPPVCGRTL